MKVMAFYCTLQRNSGIGILQKRAIRPETPDGIFIQGIFAMLMDNQGVYPQTLKLRKERAQFGMPSCRLRIGRRMAESVTNAANFHDKIYQVAHPAARKTWKQ
jgi:hypothetical protein